MSDSVQPHRRQPTRPPRSWDSPGKYTGVGCHFLLQCVKVKSLSRVQLLATPWTAAHHAAPSMGFSRQEYWSRVPLPSPGSQLIFLKIKMVRDFSGGPMVNTAFPVRGAWVPSLVGKLKSHMPCSTDNKIK